MASNPNRDSNPSSGKKGNWARKPSALLAYDDHIGTTARAVEASDRAQFHRESRTDHRKPTAYLVLPGGLKLPTAMSGDGLPDFDPVREIYRVQISGENDNTVLRISGDAAGQLSDAVKAVNNIIQSLRVKEASARQMFLVQPPKMGVVSGMISFGDGSRGSSGRPVWVAKEINTGQVADVRSLTKEDEYKKRLCKVLTGSLSSLRAERCEMHMRAIFGHLRVQQRYIVEGEYTHQEFVDFSKKVAARGAAMLHTQVGDDEAFASEMVKRLLASSKFTSGGIELRVKHTISLHSHDDVLVEADLIQSGEGVPGSKLDLISPTAYYGESNRLEITSAAPDRAYDWGIEILARETIPLPGWGRDVPKLISVFRHRSTLDFTGEGQLVVQVSPSLSRSVNETCLRTNVKLPLPDATYVVEIEIVKQWNGVDTKAKPDSSCSIRVYDPNWDESMARVVAPTPESRSRDWNVDLNILFPGEEDIGSKVEGFISHVLEIQDALVA